jgi:excisionase family DNA binding protein
MAVTQRHATKRRRLDGQTYVAIESIADYCMVSRSTVGRWVKDGELSAVKLPSGHVRITIENFRSFLKQHGMPVSKELLGP